MNSIEKIINELKEDCDELYYKDKNYKEKIKLVEEMIEETRKLESFLKMKINKINTETRPPQYCPDCKKGTDFKFVRKYNDHTDYQCCDCHAVFSVFDNK